MKTVKDVADELDVSQVTIYNHLKKNEKQLKGSVIKKKGVTHIKDAGIKVLKMSLGIMQVPEVKQEISLEEVIENISSNISNEVKNDYKNLSKDIKADYQSLKDQVENDSGSLKTEFEKLKDQNEEIKKQNAQLIELIEQNKKETIGARIKGFFKK